MTEFAEKNTDVFYNAIGLNLMHNRFEEPDLDLTKNIFSQRKYVRFHGMFCKPLFARCCMNWTAGWHSCELGYNLNTDLYLFHLRAFDYNLILKRKQARNISLDEDTKVNNFSLHFELSDDDYMKYAFPNKEKFDNAVDDMLFKEEISQFNAVETEFLKGKVKGNIKKLPIELLDKLNICSY